MYVLIRKLGHSYRKYLIACMHFLCEKSLFLIRNLKWLMSLHNIIHIYMTHKVTWQVKRYDTKSNCRKDVYQSMSTPLVTSSSFHFHKSTLNPCLRSLQPHETNVHLCSIVQYIAISAACLPMLVLAPAHTMRTLCACMNSVLYSQQAKLTVVSTKLAQQ